jgi:hypothetical protein
MLDGPDRGPSNVEERGFRGVHSDVGGGYSDILAREPLNWMWTEATASGVPLNRLRNEDRQIVPSAPLHYSSGTLEEFLEIQFQQLGWKYVRKVYYQGK